MSRLTQLVGQPDELLATAPEELALLILDDLVQYEKHHRKQPTHRTSFGRQFQLASNDVQRAIMEGWQWLAVIGAIAEAPCRDDGWYFVTRRGYELAQESNPEAIFRAHLTVRALLHRAILESAWAPFVRGDYDSAVFEAFKQVEISLREACGFGNEQIGVGLARQAFNGTSGPLREPCVVDAERQALSDLFAGAIGHFKNPHSHRDVGITDAAEAAEAVVLASHLLRIIDARRRRAASPA